MAALPGGGSGAAPTPAGDPGRSNWVASVATSVDTNISKSKFSQSFGSE